MSKYDSVYAVLQKPVAEHARNAFPLENAQSYTMKAGQITPIKAIHYKPKDYFDIKAMDFSITFPMNTAPFLRGRKEFAFYSVYYNAVWSLFNQYQATRNDPKTSAFGSVTQPIQNEPRMPLLCLYAPIVSQWMHWLYYEYVLYLVKADGNSKPSDVSIDSFRQAWLANPMDGAFEPSLDWTGVSNHITNINYNQAVVDYLAAMWSDIDPGTTLNSQYVFDVVGQWRWSNWCRKLDMLGYGNIYPLLKDTTNQLVDKFEAVAWNSSASISTCLTYFTDAVIAVLDQIILATTRFTLTDFTGTPTFVMLNLYPICAYNSIFYHFFRNSYYDLGYDSHNYNLDFLSVNSTFIADNYDFSVRFLDIEYHQWKKDKFTAVLPDQQFGVVSQITMSSSSLDTSGDVWYPDMSGYGIGPNDSIVGANASTLAVASSTQPIHHKHSVPSISQSFDVIALKRAEMLQQYRQQLMRAGNKTSDVFRALYGESPSSEHTEDIIPRFLDTFGEDIFIDPVTSTADTGQGLNGNLGDLSARGKFNGQSGTVKFNAGGNFGVILCLAYVVPTAEYNSYMLDRHLQELTPEQHYIEQFENIGLEPIYTDEINCLVSRKHLLSLGMAPRYHQKKTEVDIVHGAMTALTGLYINYGSYSRDIQFYGDFNHWVSPRTDMQRKHPVGALQYFYINPNILDNVFVQKAGADLSQDQFICRTFFDVNATKALSKVGLINFV